MTPLRLLTAGVVLVLVAAVLLWVGNSVSVDPFLRFYSIQWLAFSQFLALSLGGAGVLLILRALWRAVAPPPPLPRVFPELKLRNVTVRNRQSGSPSLVMSSLSAFSIMWICVLMILVTIFMILRPLPPAGLFIDWKEQRYLARRESVVETMSVYIARDGRFYVNGNAAKRQELEPKLRTELGRRVLWMVYLEADDDTAFMDTVYAIDTIQGLGAKVVWITPRMRAEWKKQNDEFSPANAEEIHIRR